MDEATSVAILKMHLQQREVLWDLILGSTEQS